MSACRSRRRVARRPVTWALAVGLLLAAVPGGACGGEEAGKKEDAAPGARFLYLPPAWSDRVVFYHSFESAVDKPEVNLIQGQVRGEKTEPVAGLNGRGYKAPNSYEKRTPLQLSSPALCPHKPITAMLWFRLDAAMKPETSFQLLRLGGRGYIASFVRGKGDWCALKEPTYISQVYDFPGVTNHHNSWGGRVWFEPGEWHHVAITVAGASEVRIYWDGKLRENIVIKGRLFREGDVTWAHLDPNWLYHPMSIDDVVVADRALTADEVGDYVTAARQLAARRFPAASPKAP
jgi:hypothetical protein